MRTSTKTDFGTLVLPAVLVVGAFCVTTSAQTPTASPAPRRTTTITTSATSANRVIVENKLTAPQVVTILHRLNGLKAIRLLINKEQAEILANLDEGFNLAAEVHTTVIAGLALDDGQTIAAWLPEAEAEMPPPPFFAPRAPMPPKSGTPATAPAPGASTPAAPVAALPRVTTVTIPGVPSIKIQGSLFAPADLRIITRDGKRISGQYIGLDGLTGLSLITTPNGSLPVTDSDKEEAITVGQKLRVIGPQPAPGSEVGARTPMYIRIGETEATVVNVMRSPSGGIARVRVRSAKFTPANIGGIAINDNNGTLGIVVRVEDGEATIVPMSLVRMAAKRVTARQASVPRPWLGISGEPIGGTTLERILNNGWQIDRARALAEKRQGIMLTWVAPGSPAAKAQLKRGDVILTVNDDFIRNAQEFTYLLDEATPEYPVKFTVARPERETSEAMEIKLSESPDPFFGLRHVERQVARSFKNFGRGSLLGEGIEAVALKPRVASRLGSTGGLLVLSVRPGTDAFKAGLRPGDVIEAVDGQPIYSGTTIGLFPVTPGVPSNCTVVRDKERISLTFQYYPDEDDEDAPDKPEKPVKPDKPGKQ